MLAITKDEAVVSEIPLYFDGIKILQKV